MFILT